MYFTVYKYFAYLVLNSKLHYIKYKQKYIQIEYLNIVMVICSVSILWHTSVERKVGTTRL